MEFRHLSYVVALGEELHFGRAAQRLNIVQPALSQQIKRLEDELDVALFNRSRQRVELTEAGSVLLEHGRELLARRDQALAAVMAAAAGRTGRLELGFTGPSGHGILKQILSAFRDTHPSVALNLHELTTHEQLQQIRLGAMNVGLVRLPISQDHALSVESLGEERLVVALSSDHALAGEERIGLELLATEGFVLPPADNEPAVFNRIIDLCDTAGFTPIVSQQADRIQSVINLVAAGAGVALVPESMQQLQRSDIAYVGLSDPRAMLETGIVWRADQAPAVLTDFVTTARSISQRPM